jgi:peptidyl-dipeptidase Dcp
MEHDMPAIHSSRRSGLPSALLVMSLALGACDSRESGAEPAGTAAEVAAEAAAADPAAAGGDNVLLAGWQGPYGGVPAFDRMDLGDLKPALEAGMAEQLAEIDALTANPEPPTFANTIEALERTGRTLNRVLSYWGVWSSNLSSPAFREIQQEMEPRLAEFRSKIIQNRALFDRIRAIYEGDQLASLRPDQQRLVQLIYDDFARKGATLEGAARDRYAAINQRLAELQTRFANNVLADEEGYVLYLDEGQLAGFPNRTFRPPPRLPPNAAARAGTRSPIPARQWIPS